MHNCLAVERGSSTTAAFRKSSPAVQRYSLPTIKHEPVARCLTARSATRAGHKLTSNKTNISKYESSSAWPKHTSVHDSFPAGQKLTSGTRSQSIRETSSWAKAHQQKKTLSSEKNFFSAGPKGTPASSLHSKDSGSASSSESIQSALQFAHSQNAYPSAQYYASQVPVPANKQEPTKSTLQATPSRQREYTHTGAKVRVYQ